MTLSKNSYARRRTYLLEWSKNNRPKKNAYQKKWNTKNPTKRLENDRAAKYGISKKAQREMLKDQDYKCFICKRSVKLVLDHDHATNKVRRFLCHKCNIIVGVVENSGNLLTLAAEYVRRFK